MGYSGYMVDREYYEEKFLGVGNGMLRGVMEGGFVGLWFGNILVIVARGQLYVVRWCFVPTLVTPTPPSNLSASFPPCFSRC